MRTFVIEPPAKLTNSACCCGDHPVFDTLKDADHVKQSTEHRNVQDWKRKSLAGLINHIMFDYHLFLRTELIVLNECIKKIIQAHGCKDKELIELNRLFHSMKNQLEQLLSDEEEQVFPAMKDYEKHPAPEALTQVKLSVQDLESTHIRLGNLMRDIRKVTSDYTLSADKCPAIALTYDKLQKLEAMMIEHMDVENLILFPRVIAAKES